MTDSLKASATEAFADQPVIDMHTHLYAPAFGHSGEGGGFLLWGIDELLDYHYFTDEVLRVIPRDKLTPTEYLNLPKSERTDMVWKELFVNRTPLSEACVGLVETLAALGLDPTAPDLTPYRRWFKAQDINQHTGRVMQLAGVERIVMTNEVFHKAERDLWLTEREKLTDPRFAAVVRIDALLEDRPAALQTLAGLGYDVGPDLNDQTLAEIRRFLTDWFTRTNAVYVAASLSPDFRYPSATDPDQTRIIDECLVPASNDAGIPIALMIGVRRAVNPELKLAGDGLGPADVPSIEALAHKHPATTFLVTVLSRESQHALCIAARKFRNLVPFGCWWYVNTTSMIREITRERLELLGTAFIPQHSDARVLEQLIYKWRHSRRLIAACVAERHEQLQQARPERSRAQLTQSFERAAKALLYSNIKQAIPAVAQ